MWWVSFEENPTFLHRLKIRFGPPSPQLLFEELISLLDNGVSETLYTECFASGPRGTERCPARPPEPRRQAGPSTRPSGARDGGLRARGVWGSNPLTLGRLGAGPQPGLQGQVQQEQGGSARCQHVGSPRSPRATGSDGSVGPASGSPGGTRVCEGRWAGGAGEGCAVRGWCGTGVRGAVGGGAGVRALRGAGGLAAGLGGPARCFMARRVPGRRGRAEAGAAPLAGIPLCREEGAAGARSRTAEREA